uniref:Uncharacterized protein n=1 Tax=Spongospora subterranea TaxID=70186 RepID=A0A0H5QW38_9EUKA|eukprot:CRZ05967.1 hypothetical protein [Spongospora subterranea]
MCSFFKSVTMPLLRPFAPVCGRAMITNGSTRSGVSPRPTSWPCLSRAIVLKQLKYLIDNSCSMSSILSSIAKPRAVVQRCCSPKPKPFSTAVLGRNAEFNEIARTINQVTTRISTGNINGWSLEDVHVQSSCLSHERTHSKQHQNPQRFLCSSKIRTLTIIDGQTKTKGNFRTGRHEVED